MGSADEFVIDPATGFRKTVVEHRRAALTASEHDYDWRTIMKAWFTIAASMLAGAALGGAAIQALHAQAKPPVYMIAINEVSDQERYAKEYVSPAPKSVKNHPPPDLPPRRGRSWNAGHGKPASRAGCDPSLGQHGGAASLAQLSRLSGRAQDRREIREIQHRRGQWPKIAVAQSRPRDAKGDPDLGGRDAD